MSELEPPGQEVLRQRQRPAVAGWRPALIYGVAAWAAVLILGQITAARILQVGTTQTVWAVLQRGIEGFFLLNPAALRITGTLGEGLDLVLRVCLLAGAGVAVVILFFGGRKVAERTGGGPLARGLHGMKVAVPYALPAFALSFLVSVHIPSPVLIGSSPLSSGNVWIRVPYWLALVGPLAMAASAGFFGGLWSARAALVDRGGSRALFAGALAGGWRMLMTGLGLAFVGILVVLVLDAGARHGYVAAFHSGFGKSPFVMSAPNQALFVLVPSMGGCTGIYSGTIGAKLLCYSHFPRAGGTFGTAPAPYFAFMFVPLIATVWGGFAAARVARGTGRALGALAGALAGFVFALLLFVVGAAGSPAIGGTFAQQHVSGYAGVHRPDVAILGLAWGLIGGALGGALYGKRRSGDVSVGDADQALGPSPTST